MWVLLNHCLASLTAQGTGARQRANEAPKDIPVQRRANKMPLQLPQQAPCTHVAKALTGGRPGRSRSRAAGADIGDANEAPAWPLDSSFSSRRAHAAVHIRQ
jgi:hypothetical protein